MPTLPSAPELTSQTQGISTEIAIFPRPQPESQTTYTDETWWWYILESNL